MKAILMLMLILTWTITPILIKTRLMLMINLAIIIMHLVLTQIWPSTQFQGTHLYCQPNELLYHIFYIISISNSPWIFSYMSLEVYYGTSCVCKLDYDVWMMWHVTKRNHRVELLWDWLKQKWKAELNSLMRALSCKTIIQIKTFVISSLLVCITFIGVQTGGMCSRKTLCCENSAVGRFGSFTAQFCDGMTLSTSCFGPTGEPPDGRVFKIASKS